MFYRIDFRSFKSIRSAMAIISRKYLRSNEGLYTPPLWVPRKPLQNHLKKILIKDYWDNFDTLAAKNTFVLWRKKSKKSSKIRCKPLSIMKVEFPHYKDITHTGLGTTLPPPSTTRHFCNSVGENMQLFQEGNSEMG